MAAGIHRPRLVVREDCDAGGFGVCAKETRPLQEDPLNCELDDRSFLGIFFAARLLQSAVGSQFN
jgi:hypothetical protein